MTGYIIESSMSLLILFGFYRFILRNEKLFVFNRIYLIMAIVISLVIPLISITVDLQPAANLKNIIASFETGNPEVSLSVEGEPHSDQPGQEISQSFNEVQTSGIDIPGLLTAFYFIGLMIFMARFCRNIYIISRHIDKSEKICFKEYRLILVNELRNPYCFLNNIFLNRDEYLKTGVEKDLLNHELEHFKQLHTADIIFIEIVRIFYWFNPILLLYDRAIRVNHEYLADNAVVRFSEDIKGYSARLLRFVFNINRVPFASGINNSLTKKRLMMLTRSGPEKISSGMRITLTLVLSVVLFIFLSAKQPEGNNIKMFFAPYERIDTTRIMIPVDSARLEASLSHPLYYDITRYSKGFYISNEITNKEYREFTDWLKKNPDESFFQPKDITSAVKDPVTGIMREVIFHLWERIDVADILTETIDSTAMEKLDNKFKNYFTDKKYDDYPVVGVSRKAAEFFCHWKTRTEVMTTKFRIKDMPGTNMLLSSDDYRLPSEEEWECAARQFTTEKGSKNVISKSYKEKSDELKLNHLEDNVSEWVTTSDRTTGIIRGGSWKTGNTVSERHVTDPGYRTGYIGFRIVSPVIYQFSKLGMPPKK